LEEEELLDFFDDRGAGIRTRDKSGSSTSMEGSSLTGIMLAVVGVTAVDPGVTPVV
jgi:hypothetical protein